VRFVSLLAACYLMASSVNAAGGGDVLMIFSNDRLIPAQAEVVRAMRETLATSPEPVELFEEFLDQPAFSGAAFEDTLAAYLRDKYAARPPGVIVVAGRPALEFALRKRTQIFGEVPIVHLGVDKSYLETRPPSPGVTGVPIVYEFAGTIELARQLHPHTRRLVVVTGASPSDRSWEAQTRSALTRVHGIATVEFLSALPTAAILGRLRELGDGDVVFTPGYLADGTGRVFIPRDTVAMMAAESGAPLYGLFSTAIGTGAVGGRMGSYVDMGRLAAQTAKDLLAGTPLAALKMPASLPSPVQLDWRQVRRWRIAESAIPEGAIAHFKEPTFWEAHRTQAMVIAAVIGFQALLIASLLVERRLRRRTVSALAESEKRMSLAARAAGLSVWVWEIARDKRAQPVPSKSAGGAPKETHAAFSGVVEAVHPADREGFDRAVRDAVARGGEVDVEYRRVQPGGEVHWIAARGQVDKDKGEHVIGVAIDITTRKLAELQAERDRAALANMNRVSTLGQLSASIAHQLNQPLAAVIGNAEVARKLLDREPPDLAELRQIYDDIVTENLRAADVIRRLGGLYRRGEIHLTRLDVNGLVLETLDLVRTELVTRQVIAVTELAPSIPAIRAGRIELQQVFLNLILNGADAMSEVEASQRRLVIRTSFDADSISVCVADHGVGIAAENMKSVFDPFWTTKAGGTGVGLAICQSIVAAHRGTLSVDNTPGGGATFCVRLPVSASG
jgi:C4-dicarboxylate-specific signal transduction histidine kinase